MIAVLLGILLPALATSRARAGLLAFQVNQRECANIILLYTHDAAGLFPSYGVEKTMRAPLEWKGQLVESSWWGQIEYWGLFLTTRGYEGWVSMGPDAGPSVFDRVDCAGCGHARSIHLMMAGAFAHPKLFVHGAMDVSDLHVVQRSDGVASPSNKGLLVFRYWSVGPLGPVTFVDGHGELLSESAMAPGAGVEIPFAPRPVVTTRHGVRGSDR